MSAYSKANAYYQTQVNSFSQMSVLQEDTKKSIIGNIPRPNNGMNITTRDINDVITNITNIQTQYNNQIQAEIDRQNAKLSTSSKEETDTENDYTKYMTELNKEVQKLISQIEQNNNIINRQQSEYDKLNSDYSYIDNKNNEVKNIDKIGNLNTELISNYSSKNSLMIKIYPYIICVIILCVLYFGYITFNKLKDNVYSNYV
jgi:chromosome segregation ATPase